MNNDYSDSDRAVEYALLSSTQNIVFTYSTRQLILVISNHANDLILAISYLTGFELIRGDSDDAY